jgi:hypothetical protein
MREKVPSDEPQRIGLLRLDLLIPIYVANGGTYVKGILTSYHQVPLRTCKVACRDIEGVEHSVEVRADSLYEAVARGLAALRDADWAAGVGHGQTTISVVVKQPEVEHRVRMRDFEAWLESNGRSPAEMTLRSRLRELLGK